MKKKYIAGIVLAILTSIITFGYYYYLDSNALTESSKYRKLQKKLQEKNSYSFSVDSISWCVEFLMAYPSGPHAKEVSDMLDELMLKKIAESEKECISHINTDDSTHLQVSLHEVDTLTNWYCPLLHLYKDWANFDESIFPNYEISPKLNKRVYESCVKLRRLYVWNKYLSVISPNNIYYADAKNWQHKLSQERNIANNFGSISEDDAYSIVKSAKSLSMAETFAKHFPNGKHYNDIHLLINQMVKNSKPYFVDNDSLGFLENYYLPSELCQVTIYNAEYGKLKVLYDGPVYYIINLKPFETKSFVIPKGTYTSTSQVYYSDLQGKESSRSRVLEEKMRLNQDSYSYEIGEKWRMILKESQSVKEKMFGI